MAAASREYDRLVIGAGVFGLAAAHLIASRGQSVAVVDVDPGRVMRASLVNQARLHNGYHYPRSAYTALRSAHYYDRFVTDFPEAVNRRFTALYAVSATGSWTDAAHFEKFCANVGIPARSVDPRTWFTPGAVEAVYETDEHGFDAPTLRRLLLERIDAAAGTCSWHLADRVEQAEVEDGAWSVRLRSGTQLSARGVVNATYAGTNGVLQAFGLPPLGLKYELCEVALVEAPGFADVGITVMDGPFFSPMPFGHSGLHSLTAVDYTPRLTSDDVVPTFGCQELNPACAPAALDNCGLCPVRPETAFPQMQALSRRYLAQAGGLRLVEGIHSVKAVLRTAEVDDARPTLVRVQREQPSFVSLFSGKINTLYDLEDVL